MTKERFLQLLSRKIAGEATMQELDELQQIMQNNAEWQLFGDHILSEENTKMPPLSSHDEENAYERLTQKLKAQTTQIETENTLEVSYRRRLYRVVGVAASLAFLTAFGWYWWEKTPNKAASAHEITTQKGAMTTVKLPDGSNVWLNSDSKLTYNDGFNAQAREVVLVGEAYFDVAKDSLKPFIIHTEKIDIKVLGTAFNVKSYLNDETTETALIRGKVEITFKDRPTEKIILRPNEKLVVNKNQSILSQTSKTAQSETSLPKVTLKNIKMIEDTLVAETAWINNTLVFDDNNLMHISQVLERKFNVKFEFKNEELKHYTYTSTYEHENLERILYYLSITQPFKYTVRDGKVTIGK